MTTSITTNRWEYSGNGVTTSFAVNGPFNLAAELEVWKQVVATGVETLQTITTHYTVSGGGGSTGSVVFGTAPASGERVVIIRKEPLTSDVTDAAERFDAAGFEAAFDHVARQVQRVYDMASRSIMLRVSDLVSGVAGLFDAGSRRIANVANPVNAQDVVTKAYGDANYAAGIDGDDGEPGVDGDDGWAPVLAIVADGVRRVHQIVGYAGGTGAVPTAYLNYYIGALGPVVAIGDGVDIRGSAGAGTGDMLAANNLSDLISAATARTNLGITTAAISHAGVQTFAAATTYPAVVYSNDAEAGYGPYLLIQRDSASPAANDGLGGIQWGGEDAAGNFTVYAGIQAYIDDPTDATETATLTLQSRRQGSLDDRVYIGTGLFMPGATGFDMGTGTVNAVGLYINGKAVLTDPVLTGAITEDIFTITDGAGFEIDPSNGSIQFVTLDASRTPAATNFGNGESVTLRIADGSAYTITWSTVGVVWKGGVAPTLATSGYTEVHLEKAGNVIRGVHVGDFAS